MMLDLFTTGQVLSGTVPISNDLVYCQNFVRWAMTWYSWYHFSYYANLD